MKYRCIIVDDEELARGLIETHLFQVANFELVATCASAIEAHQVLQEEEIDLMFLDIEMPVLKGTDFLKNLTQPPKVILTTAYREYAMDGFELNVVDYLLKPIIFSRFLKSIEKFIALVGKSNVISNKPNHIFIQSNKKNIKVVLDDILYVESIKDYIRIHFVGEKIIFKSGISAFANRLDQRFLRVHRSFIVNVNKVTAYTKKDIELDKIQIPIGEFYKKEVLERIKLI